MLKGHPPVALREAFISSGLTVSAFACEINVTVDTLQRALREDAVVVRGVIHTPMRRLGKSIGGVNMGALLRLVKPQSILGGIYD